MLCMKIMMIRHRRFCGLCLVCCFVLVTIPILLYVSDTDVDYDPCPDNTCQIDEIDSSKSILWFYPPSYINGINNRMPLKACPDLHCRLTTNRSYLPNSHAVLFTGEHISSWRTPNRRIGQTWIFHNKETPYLSGQRTLHMLEYTRWNSVFNWTMDYRRDADIVRPYAKLRKRKHVTNKNYAAILKNKTKLVALMVSNCDDKFGRITYAKELQKHIPVDIFGECGKRLLDRQNNSAWLNILNTSYKFYLSFENSFCKDYITEKFFNVFNLDVIPVVRGGGDYNAVAPPGTFINSAHFRSAKELAEYIQYLDDNDDKYIEILRRKEKYFYDSEEYTFLAVYSDPFKASEYYVESHYEAVPMCELCRRLYNTDNHRKSIQDVATWFRKGLCYVPTDV